MSDNIENLILEHLKNLRNDLREFREETRSDLQTIKMRLNSLERSNAGLHDDNAITQTRLDRVDERIDRIERRMELVG